MEPWSAGWVSGRHFSRQPYGFMNTGTLSATSRRAHLRTIQSRGITKIDEADSNKRCNLQSKHFTGFKPVKR